MERNLRNKIRYIYWKEDAIKINLKQEDFKKLFDSLDRSKYIRSSRAVPTNKLVWINKGNNSWTYKTVNEKYEYLFMFQDDNFYIYDSCYMDNEKNTEAVFDAGELYSRPTTKAFKSVKDRFKEINNISFLKAFGTVTEDFKMYIPRQFEYNLNGRYKQITYHKNVSSIDFSSMYPSRISKMLPDAHTRIEVDKYVEPNEEYKFAFYPESGHLAIYNELDTHDWMLSSYRDYLFKNVNNTNKNNLAFIQHPEVVETKTILMKESKYNLYQIYKEAYDNRKLDENAKAIMNSSIGQMHRNKYTRDRYAHLVAICIARSTNDMLNVLKNIKRENVIQICVDGIIYKNTRDLGLDSSYKDLGVCIQEYSNCMCSYRGMNCYVVVDNDNNIIKIKSQGYNTIDEKPIDTNTVKDIKDIEKFYKIDSKHLERQQYMEEINNGKI